MERLDGKRIIITGGTSGMGEGMTRAFPGLGAKVVFWGRNEAAGAKIAEDSGATFVRVEISDEDSVNAAMEKSVEILGGEDGRVNGMKCIKMELGEPDASGRRRPIPVEGSEFVLDVDTVIMSLGTSPNPLIRSTTPGLETNKKGGIIVDENEMSTRENVFAGGDAVTGAATVILAMGAGKKAAEAIDRKLQAK